MISDLNRSLGPRQFLNVANERTCILHRARAHLKVPGCSLVWKALLTKKLPMFLSRLNEVNERTCILHRARAHLKVPGCSLVWKALLTKKLPMFLSRLNEVNGGCEKILLVSGSF